jgi:hypothetical protein
MAILKSRNAQRVIVLAAFAILFLWLKPARADDTTQPLQLYEEKIKAGLVYSFLKYTNWSAEALAKSNNKLLVCLLGHDEFDDDLYLMQGRTVQQYTIVISHIDSAADAGSCNMVFIHRNRENSLPELFKYLRGKYVLTVSDINQFSRRGGMVEFSTEDNHVGFSANYKTLNSAGFSIQGRLLKLAKPDYDRDD